MTGHDVEMNVNDAINQLAKLAQEVVNHDRLAWTLLHHAREYLYKQMMEAHAHAEDLWVSESN